MSVFYKNKKDIIDWLDEYKVKNYTLLPNEKYGFVVNVAGDLDLNRKNLLFIPVKFNEIKGALFCGQNQLTSIEFSPDYIGRSFYCNDNNLTTLEFCPGYVGGIFNCGSNKLSSLKFCPQIVGDDFYCDNNKLTSLEFCPQRVGGIFACGDNIELKKVQKIRNFKDIYLMHREFLINKFSEKLSNSLNSVETNKKQSKIKL